MALTPQVTVVIPCLNQGRFLERALDSVLEQGLSIELIIMDGGSTDKTIQILQRYERELFHWQSGPDNGQAAAVNAGMRQGRAPLVCWLNSDDFFYPGALMRLREKLQCRPSAPFVYGQAWHVNEVGHRRVPYLTLPYHPYLFANYCGICQPATLIRRNCWEAVGGLDESLELAFDYDLWFRLVAGFGRPETVSAFVAANRMHNQTKTSLRLDQHYDESIRVVRRHHGSIPVKWALTRGIMRRVRGVARFLRRRTLFEN